MFALNPQQDSCINLLAIVVVTVILQMWAWVSGGVYNNWCLDALEGSFALNLTILGVATYHIKSQEEINSQLVCLYSTCNIHWDLCLSVGKCDWHYSIPEEKIANRNLRQAEAEMEPPGIGSLPDRLINPGEYQQPFYNLHATAEPTEKVTEEQRRLITPVYT